MGDLPPPENVVPPAALPAASTGVEAAAPVAEAAVPASADQPDVVPAPAPAAETPVTPAGQSGQQDQPVASAAVVRFKFDQPSWVEIRDRGGKILLSQLNAAGSEKEVAGDPPLSLVVGNASYVTLW